MNQLLEAWVSSRLGSRAWPSAIPTWAHVY